MYNRRPFKPLVGHRRPVGKSLSLLETVFAHGCVSIIPGNLCESEHGLRPAFLTQVHYE